MVSEIPQYVRQLTSISSIAPVQVDTSGAQLTQQVSASFAEKSARIKQKAFENERLRSKALMQTEMARIYRENESSPETLQPSLQNFKRGFLGQINNPELANEFDSTFDIASIPYVDRAYNNYANIVDTENEKLVIQSYDGLIENIKNNVKSLQSNMPEHSNASYSALQNNFKEAAELANARRSDGQYIFSADQQIELAGVAQAAALRDAPLQDRALALAPPTGFERNFAMVMQAEIDPRDPDKIHPDGDGSMAKYGINSAANPDIDLENLTFERATQIYRDRYWDPLNIDSLPANMQGIVFDAAVNQGQGYAKQLIAEIEKGAGPAELLQMRQDRYAKTKGEDFEKESWSNRLKKYQPFVLTEFTENMPYQLKEKLQTEAYKEMEKMQTLRNDDFGAYADQMGLNNEQRMIEQQDKIRPVLLAEDTAKALVSQANQLSSVDDVFKVAIDLKQQGGEYYNVLMQDLRRQKLNPRVESAINLANENPARYMRHIELLMKSYQLDKGEGDDDVTLDSSFKRAGHDKTTFTPDWIEATQDIRELMTREGIDHLDAELMAYEKLAMMHAIEGNDIDDAIEFALEPLLDRHNVITLNGVDVRVPRVVKDPSNPQDHGITLNKDVMEDRLEMAYNDIVNDIIKQKKKDDKLFDRDDVIPVLNAQENGIIFRDSLGTPLMNDDDEIYEINFRDMRTQEFSEERIRRLRDELMQLPYGQRQQRRKQVFGISDEPFDPHGSRK